MAFVCNQIEPSSTADLLNKLEAELVSMGWVLHDEYIAFTSGGTHEVLAGDTLTGATSGATCLVVDVVLNTGTWASGTAAGYFGISTVTGQFVSENLNEGVNSAVCTITGYYYVVYKSNGEDADRIYEYIRFALSATTIAPRAYGWWNNTTHGGSGVAYYASNTYLTYTAGEKLVISGTKNLVVTHRIGYTGYSTYNIMFGHIPKRFYTSPLATLTAPVVAGDGKTISLDNTTKFIPNQTYWIFGLAGEGWDRIKVTSVDAGVSITGDGLTIGFATGAKIGAFPNMFVGSSTGNLYCTHARVVGTGGSALTATIIPFVPISVLSPDYSLGYAAAPLSTPGLYVLQPMLFIDTTNDEAIGYSDNYILYAPVGTNDTIFGVTSDGKPLDTGTATDGSSKTLTCTGKGWGVNDYADKTVFIDSGTGAGYSRRIVSNTSEILTVNTQWDITPNNTSIFYIVDEVYRSVSAYPDVAYREYI
jgi:hypothetical protein